MTSGCVAASVDAARRSASSATPSLMFTRCLSAVLARSTRPLSKLGSTSADLANAIAERVRASFPSMVLMPVTKEIWESPMPYSAKPIP